MNNFHEFTVGGCAVDMVYVHHEKCGWYWDSGEQSEDIKLRELLKIISEHVCEEKQ